MLVTLVHPGAVDMTPQPVIGEDVHDGPVKIGVMYAVPPVGAKISAEMMTRHFRDGPMSAVADGPTVVRSTHDGY